MKKIYLKNKDVYALVDDEDFDELNQWKWYADEIGGVMYVKRRRYPDRKMLYMHREILKAGDNLVDHKDHNGLNNQRSNLRICSSSQNQWNKRSKRNGTSKYIGVSYDISRGKWTARCCINYKNHNIGRFDTEVKAALAYNKKAIELHGEFANLNIIA